MLLELILPDMLNMFMNFQKKNLMKAFKAIINFTEGDINYLAMFEILEGKDMAIVCSKKIAEYKEK